MIMSLPPFDLARPRTVAEACALLADADTEAIAGGTQLLSAMKNRTRAPRRLVDLASISGLDSIDYRATRGLTIGARVTLAHLAAHPDVLRHYVVISEAARLVATPQIQSMATIAGNLCQDTCCLYVDRALEQRDALGPCLKLDGDICHVVPGSDHCWANYASDLAPVLIALGATVTIATTAGEQQHDLQTFFSGEGEQPIALGRGELITAIQIPPPAPHSGAAYLKLRRRGSLEYPLLGVAAAVTGTKLIVVLTGVDRGPVIVEGTSIEDLARSASRRVHPVKNAFGYGPNYRIRVIKPFVTRAVRTAIARAEVECD